MRWTSLLAVTAAMLGALAGGARADAQATPVVSDKVLAGRIDSSRTREPGTRIDTGHATALVDASFEQVVAAVQQYASYKDVLPGFRTSRVLSQRGASALVYIEVDVLNGARKLWAELKIRPKKSDGPGYVLEAKMTKGNMKAFSAVWKVRPYSDTQTLLSLSLLVDPDLPLPASMLGAENQVSARKAIRAVRKTFNPAQDSDD